MKRFRYTARAKSGARTSGVLSAASATQAADQLHGSGLSPISMKPIEEAKLAPLSFAEATTLAASLGRLTRSGVALELAVRLISETESSPRARDILDRASARLETGAGVAEAFSGLQGAPGATFSAICAAGERTGDLSGVLNKAAPLLSTIARFRERIISLSIYPMVVAATALGVIALFLLVVVPNLRPVLESLGDDAPFAAQALLGTADAAPVVIGTILTLILATIVLAQAPTVRRRLQTLKDALLLGPVGLGLVRAIDTALFARLFGALLEAGAPADQAMRYAASSVGNSILKHRLMAAADQVREGEAVDTALETALGRRDLIVRACRLATKSANLATLVSDTGLHLSERAEVRLERLAAIAGPAIIITLGAVIGLMTIGLFTSLTALTDGVG